MRWYRLSIGEYGKIYTTETTTKKETSTLKSGEVVESVVSNTKTTDTKRYGATADSGGITFESNKLYPRNYNPTPLNIEFEVHSYEAAGKGSTLCGIRLYNQSVTFFRTLQNMVTQDYENGGSGIDITLEAGYDYTNPIVTEKMRYNDLGLGSAMTIFKGQMAGITGDFNGKTSHINITGALTKLDKKGVNIHIRKGEKLFTQVDGEAEFTDGKYNSSSLLQAIKLFVNEHYKIVLADDIVEARCANDKDIVESFDNFETFANYIQRSKNYNFNIFVDNQAGFVGIYKKPSEYKDKDQKEKKTSAEINSENATEMAKVRAKFIGDSNSYSKFLVPKKISASELITQPTFQGFSETLEVAIALRPDITLGSIIELPEVINQMGGTFGTSNQYISDIANQMNLAYGGTRWMVYECIHRGGFYSRSPESWCSVLLCVVYDKNLKAKESEAAASKAVDSLTQKRNEAFSMMGINQSGLIGSNVIF